MHSLGLAVVLEVVLPSSIACQRYDEAGMRDLPPCHMPLATHTSLCRHSTVETSLYSIYCIFTLSRCIDKARGAARLHVSPLTTHSAIRSPRSNL